jgi:hypothetical protein
MPRHSRITRGKPTTRVRSISVRSSSVVALCRQLGYSQQLVTSLSVLTWIRQARGDQGGALEAIGEAERLVPNPNVLADIPFPVAVGRARLLLAQGKVDDAAARSNFGG